MPGLRAWTTATRGHAHIQSTSKEEIVYAPQCGIEQFALFGPSLTGIPNVSDNVELMPNAVRMITRLSAMQPVTTPAHTANFLELGSSRRFPNS